MFLTLIPLKGVLIKCLSNFASMSDFTLCRSSVTSPQNVLLCLDVGKYLLASKWLGATTWEFSSFRQYKLDCKVLYL